MVFGFFDEWQHDETGEKVGEEKSEKGWPRISKNDGNGSGEEPVAVTDPFAFGDQVKCQIEATKYGDGGKRTPDEFQREGVGLEKDGGAQAKYNDGDDDSNDEVLHGEFAVKTVINSEKSDGYNEDECDNEGYPAKDAGGNRVKSSTNSQERQASAEFGEEFSEADFGFAFAALPFQDEP